MGRAHLRVTPNRSMGNPNFDQSILSITAVSSHAAPYTIDAAGRAKNFGVYSARKVCRKMKRESFDIATRTIKRLMRYIGP